MNFKELIHDEKTVFNLFKEDSSSSENLLLTYFNQNCFNLYYKYNTYAQIIDSKFSVYIDGIGVYLALKLLGYKPSQRFNASDLNEKFFEFVREKKLRLYLIGGKFSNDLIKKYIATGLNIVGYSNGYFCESEELGLIDRIACTIPDIIYIGMGVPLQEILASKIDAKVSGKKIICGGNFLEFYFGTTKRIPVILRNSGVEWIYRLIVEPKRLWKRYIIGIPEFFLRILLMILKGEK